MARIIAAALGSILFTASSATTTSPRCPDSGNGTADPYPAYAPIGSPPAVTVWQGLAELPETCRIHLVEPAAMIVALSGSFSHTGPIDAIAARLGSLSATVGLPYWSVSDGKWAPLVSDASALDSPDASDVRADFSAREVLEADTLYFAQNDSRSWGMNVYRLRVLDASADRLTVQVDNLSRIKLGPITLFAPRAATALHVVRRLDDATWGYYGLSLIRSSAFEPREKSLVNRQAALYRFLTKRTPNAEPPLAP